MSTACASPSTVSLTKVSNVYIIMWYILCGIYYVCILYMAEEEEEEDGVYVLYQ